MRTSTGLDLSLDSFTDANLTGGARLVTSSPFPAGAAAAVLHSGGSSDPASPDTVILPRQRPERRHLHAQRDSSLDATGHATIFLDDIQAASLSGGTGNDTFTLSAWTGTATLTGGGGHDALAVDSVAFNGDHVPQPDNMVLSRQRPDARAAGGEVKLTDTFAQATLFANDAVAGNKLDASSFSGNAVLFGGSGPDTLLGGSGDDELFGGSGDDSLVAGSGNNYLEGDDGNDYLEAGDGSNNFTGGLGFNSDIGGGGFDSVFENGDFNFTLQDTDLTATDLVTGEVVLEDKFPSAGISQADLEERAGHDNTFTLTGWSGFANLYGDATAPTRWCCRQDTDMTLDDAAATRGIDGRSAPAGIISFANINRAVLTGGDSGNRIDASAVKLGTVTLVGGSGLTSSTAATRRLIRSVRQRR